MAFSWNPFSRAHNTSTYPMSVGESAVPRNPNYKTFEGVANDIERIVASKSVVGQAVKAQSPLANPIWQSFGIDSDLLVAPIATNKADRLNQYRSIAKFTECDWCLDEIADEFVHEDAQGNFINLKLPDGKKNLNETRKGILQEQFEQYMSLFKFRDEGYNLIKRFLIEGELAWENVIDPKQPELGIKGVKFLPAEYYETIIDKRTNCAVGIIFDSQKMAADIHEVLSNSYLGSAQIFNKITPSMVNFQFNKDTCVPMLWSQLTYINSGEVSHDGLISYPIIEKTRQAYHQLALLQESAVVLRVTRAPERLLFNVSTGNMNQTYADEFVRNFANGLKAKKTARPNGDVASVYNPVSMLESYVFGKANGNDGTSVETVGSTANYDELGDIEYFLRRFFKQFKVPFSRYKTPENAVPPQDQLSYEEHSFLRMIVRLQRRFALGFKNGFITHLKLRDIWDKYELKDSDIDVSFVKPSMYELLEVQQVMNTKMEIYKAAIGDNDEFSKSLAMKKFLGFTDAEIKENFEGLIRDKEMAEYTEYIGSQVAEKKGLDGWEPTIKLKADAEAEAKKETADADKGAAKADDSSSEDKEASDESSEEAGSEEEAAADEESEPAEEPKAEEPKETPTPTFGLG